MGNLKAKARKLPILGIGRLIKHNLADEVCRKCRADCRTIGPGTRYARIHCDDIS
jgi:hypothetical protein